MPPTIAASSERSGMRQIGAKRSASPAANSAPSTMPKSITEVTSVNRLPLNCAARAGDDQYGHAATSTPTAASAFEPHSANAEVMPHGRPASASVATLSSANASA